MRRRFENQDQQPLLERRIVIITGTVLMCLMVYMFGLPATQTWILIGVISLVGIAQTVAIHKDQQ